MHIHRHFHMLQTTEMTHLAKVLCLLARHMNQKLHVKVQDLSMAVANMD